MSEVYTLYTHSDIETAITAASEGSMGCIAFKVRGYWSGDSITIYLRRELFNSSDRSVYAEVRHAGGGRDTKEVESDIEAARNFGVALVAAADLADKIIAERGEEMNNRYTAFLDKLTTDAAAEAAARKAKAEADKPLGLTRAYVLVSAAEKKAFENENDNVYIEVFDRGSDYANRFINVKSRVNTTFNIAGRRTSRKEVVAMLALASERCCLG